MGNTASLSTDELAMLYGSGISAYRLAKNNGCSIWSVITRLRNIGVKIRPDGTPKNFQLNQEQKLTFHSLNVGLLLGDASINGNLKNRSNRCFLRIEQSNIRYGWLNQIFDFYRNLGIHVNIIPVKLKKKKPSIKGREINQGPSSLLYTGVSDEFRELRSRWYPDDGKKIVPKDVKLDALSVAMWFCGDGSSSSKNKGSFSFYTNGFKKSDVEFLSNQLEGLGISVHPRLHREGEWIIVTNGRSTSIKLRDLILPYMPGCCLYKFKHLRPLKVVDL